MFKSVILHRLPTCAYYCRCFACLIQQMLNQELGSTPRRPLSLRRRFSYSMNSQHISFRRNLATLIRRSSSVAHSLCADSFSKIAMDCVLVHGNNHSRPVVVDIPVDYSGISEVSRRPLLANNPARRPFDAALHPSHYLILNWIR
jgi:hypothetical protein